MIVTTGKQCRSNNVDCQCQLMPSSGNIPDPLTHQVIGAAIEVHRHLGPGLLESVYEECLAHEMTILGLVSVRQRRIPVIYKGMKMSASYRPDIIVDDQLIVEVKACEKVIEVHEAQLLTYLKVTGIHTGLLLNFNTATLATGIKRISL